MPEIYDVIVTGMGPAGSMAAHHLARAGLKVLALEKRCMPRPKLCAGGLTPRALEMLTDCDFSVAKECEVRGGMAYTHRGHDLEMYSEDKMGIIVDRSRFDHVLLKRAAEQGVTVHQGEPVQKIVPGKTITVTTSRDTYLARYLIGADGANSVVALSLGYQRRHGGYTLECFIPDTHEVVSRHAGSLTFYYGFLPSGYAWMFPKKGGASVGIGVLAKHTREIRTHFEKFLRAIGLPPEYAAHCKGFPLPAYTPRTHNKHGKDNILLAGDAACLVDPITGEGISYAMRSGVLAAQAIQESLKGRGKASSLYGQSLKGIKQDLLVAFLMSIPLNTAPNLSILVLRENRQIVHLLKDIMLGQGRYGELIWALIKAIPNTIWAYLKGHR